MITWRTLDLFAGIGLFSVGLHRAGMDTAAACEICPKKRVLLREVLGHSVPIYEDIETLSGEEVTNLVGSIDLVAGSPPCTDISSANPNGRGVDGDESRLFFEAIRLVRETRPRWVCLENSSNVRTRGADRLLTELEAAGYACWPLVVGAVHAGAPHHRLRSWIVATDPDAPREQMGVRGQSWAQDDPDADGAGRTAEVGRRLGVDAAVASIVPDADGAGLAFWQGLAGDHGPQLAALERNTGAAIHTWAGGLGRYLRLVDGLPANVARFVMSACGDAVVCSVVEAIALGIRSADLAAREQAPEARKP